MISVALSPKEAGRDVVLKANLTVGEKSVSATFTFGIVKYAEKIINDGSDIEKTLVCDVLSYIRAAYAYFETEDANIVAKINAVLGKNYDENNAPALNGSTVAPTEGLESVTFVLDAEPTIRFYLASGVDATAYKFYIDGVKVNTVSGVNSNGTYIDIDTYAYAVSKTLTYTIYDFEAGSFNIAAYYEWAKMQNNDALVTLVARFIKYSESAEAYRCSVVDQ